MNIESLFNANTQKNNKYKISFDDISMSMNVYCNNCFDIDVLRSYLPNSLKITECIENDSRFSLNIIISEELKDYMDYYEQCSKIETEIMIHGGNFQSFVSQKYDDTYRILFKKEEGTILFINYEESKIFCVTNNLSSFVSQIIKNIFLESAKEDGHIVLHAGAFEYNGKAFAICGDKGAGKTTFLLNSLIADKTTTYISNDRILLKIIDDEIMVNSWGSIINIGRGSLISLRENYNITNYKLNSIIDMLNTNKDKKVFTLKELMDVLYIKNMKTRSTLGGIIIPNICFDKKTEIRVVEFNEYRNIIMRNFLNIDYDEHPNWLNFINTDVNKISEREYKIAKFINSNIPIYHLNIGQDIQDIFSHLKVMISKGENAIC
jgi:hypothetical protein